MKTVTLGVLAVLLASSPQMAFAQQPIDPALLQQFQADLQHAMANSNITDQQKQQILTDLDQLREARQAHDRRAGRSALLNMRSQIDKANFQKDDKQKLHADFQAIRAARGR